MIYTSYVKPVVSCIRQHAQHFLTPVWGIAVQPSIHAKPFIPTSASTGQLASANSTPPSMSSAARPFVPGSAGALLSPAASGAPTCQAVSDRCCAKAWHAEHKDVLGCLAICAWQCSCICCHLLPQGLCQLPLALRRRACAFAQHACVMLSASKLYVGQLISGSWCLALLLHCCRMQPQVLRLMLCMVWLGTCACLHANTCNIHFPQLGKLS